MRARKAAFLAAVAVGLAACGGTSTPSTPSTPVTPAASAVPASGNISATQSVVVRFNTAMNAGSLMLGGTMAPGASAVWTSPDVLTVGPSASAWTAGAQTLTIGCSSTGGMSMAQMSLAYTVDPAANCSAGGAGACVNATDCAFTFTDLAGFAQACVSTVTPFGDAAAISACVHGNGPTSACSDCIGAFAHCGVFNCSTACAGGLTAPACTSCLDSKGCTGALRTCTGR